MAKLVVLTQSMAGRSFDLAGERTTVGRVEDNAFQIAEPSVSSRHCEILLRGEDIVIKDLNSTNGTFINGEKISEGVLKPGQTLRLGNVELKLDVPGAPAALSTPAAPSAPVAGPSPSAPAPATPPAAPASPSTPAASSPTKKAVATGGVSVTDLGGGGRPPGFDTTSKDFTRKKAGKTMIFWIVVGVALFIIVILILVIINSAKSGAPSA
jgi:pSer/pThr/pTyr-binding forkhead associated (FHA) protein